MIKTILLKRLMAVGFTLLMTAVVPFIVQDRPVLSSTWGKYGPEIVDLAQDRITTRLEQLD